MFHIKPENINITTAILNAGGIIAYPTEAVYGLGCDPFNEAAVLKLLELKHRSVEKGLILLSHSWEIVAPLTKPVEQKILDKILKTWPGPVTWVFPVDLTKVPIWVRGKFTTIAIRITNHPVAKTICENFASPIISTSANIEGEMPAKTYEEVKNYFPTGIDYIAEGNIGNLEKPTPIYDAITGNAFRN